MLLLLLVLESALLLLSYSITYDSNYKESEKNIRKALTMAVEMCESIDLYAPSEYVDPDALLTQLCGVCDVAYLFAVEPDLDTGSETYLAIGFGKDALKEVKDTRYRGVHVTGSLNKEQIEAYNGNTEGIILHERNRFDDSLVCYMPCTRYLDKKTDSYVKYQKPAIIGAEISLDSVNKESQDKFRMLAILTVSTTLLIALSFGVILYFKVFKPVTRISMIMTGYITDREKGIEKLEIKGKDEFAQMSKAFNTMTDEIDRYINDIDALTKEKHTRETEINIAHRIQMGLLQPDSLSTYSCAINAFILPAKDVGGDLYDYCLLDDGRIFIAIADVSGKGISAALFMSRAITLLHQYSKIYQSPAKILEEYNNTLASQNPGGLFITTFLMIWDPSCGRLTYSNAGHNFPYLLSDTLISLEDAHGIAAGLFYGETYEDACIYPKEGDELFLFTDGVNEAKNAEDEFFTTERLEKTLSSLIRTDTDDTIQKILTALNDFTQGAEQSDDITMLTLRVKEKPLQTVLKLTSEVTQLVSLREAIKAFPVDDELKNMLLLAAEEIFVNICSYAYDAPGEVEVKLSAGDRVEMVFSDSGKPFDPTVDVPDMDEYDHENSIGGLGRFLTFSIADEYRYEYRGGRNILTLYFKKAIN